MAFSSYSSFQKCSQNPQQTSKNLSTSGNSTAKNYPLPPPHTEFVTVEDLEFYRAGWTSYRMTVNTIERNPYVAISHWFFNRQQASWFPTRKQIFLPNAAWFGLLEQADRISRSVDTIPDLEEQEAAGGSQGVSQFANT